MRLRCTGILACRRHGSCRGNPAGLSLASSSSICSNRRSACRATISASCPHSSARCNGMSFGAAADAGIDALVGVYHSDHRELCAHARDWPFRIINVLEVVCASMGLHPTTVYKELKLMQDVRPDRRRCRT